MALSLLSSLIPSVRAFFFVLPELLYWSPSQRLKYCRLFFLGRKWKTFLAQNVGRTENGNCDSTRFSRTKNLWRESYFIRSSHFQRCRRRFSNRWGHEFYKLKASQMIKVHTRSPQVPESLDRQKSMFLLMMRTIIVHTKYILFLPRGY